MTAYLFYPTLEPSSYSCVTPGCTGYPPHLESGRSRARRVRLEELIQGWGRPPKFREIGARGAQPRTRSTLAPSTTYEGTGASGPRVAGLFAGIGGIELGFTHAGYRPVLLCENNESAVRVLKARFPEGPEPVGDIRALASVPAAEVVTAGFPCADLSPAGALAGIKGGQSGLVSDVFRLLRGASDVQWVLLENVPFMLQLHRGAAIRFIVESLESLGFRWAYRVIDTRAFGIPQRRRRAFVLASRDLDPVPVLLGSAAEPRPRPDIWRVGGFYWTEGNRGVGWVREAIPPLKGSSGLGIPSAPAIWDRASGSFVTPTIQDAERLQGFPADWTQPAKTMGQRWKLVGNAVSVPVAEWIASRLFSPAMSPDRDLQRRPLLGGEKWPSAATGFRGSRYRVDVGDWPVDHAPRPLRAFMRDRGSPLSPRAARGFLRRARASRLRFEEGFLESLEEYVRRGDMERKTAGMAGTDASPQPLFSSAPHEPSRADVVVKEPTKTLR